MYGSLAHKACPDTNHRFDGLISRNTSSHYHTLLKYLFNYLAGELLIFSACYAVRHTALTALSMSEFLWCQTIIDAVPNHKRQTTSVMTDNWTRD
jgi:hypothetical protein